MCFYFYCVLRSGNLVWNGGTEMPLGVGGDACAPSNPTCSEVQLLAQNAFNAIDPQLAAFNSR